MLVVTCPYFLRQFSQILYKILRRIVVQDSLAIFLNVKKQEASYTFHTNNHKNSSFNPIKLELVLLIATRTQFVQKVCSQMQIKHRIIFIII